MDAAFHVKLAHYNHTRFAPSLPEQESVGSVAEEALFHFRETAMLDEARKEVAARAAGAPSASADFVKWFEALEERGPGQNDSLFPWLAESASMSELKWFLRQEVAGEAGFDDLVALTQLKMPARAKLELARNYWDEVGRGMPNGMHGAMLEHLSRALRLESVSGPIVCEAIALGNLMIGMAANRRYAYHSIGALGVIELTAPRRAEQVNVALKRHGIDAHVRQYFALHATLDVKHSASWNREVIAPLVAQEPRAAQAIAEGALMRLEAGHRCFERYRAELGVAAPTRIRRAS